MNGTPIENLRYMQQSQFGPSMQTGDDFNDNIGRQEHSGSMDQLAKEVNDSLDEITVQHEQPRQQSFPTEPQKKLNQGGVMKNVPEFLREPLILVIIYIILSLDVVKKTLSAYIPQIKPTADGNILFVGILIYAIILAISYVVVKKALL